jgi:predicted small metal-binding protein
MKGMTCKELGGACNLKLMAQSWGDMVLLMARHLKERHPDIAERMQHIQREDPTRWSRESKRRWGAVPEEPRLA